MERLNGGAPVPLGHALAGILTNPRDTFARFPDRQPWLAAMLVFGLVTAAAQLWMFAETLPDITQGAKDASEAAGLTPGQAALAAQVARGVTLVLATLGGLLAPAVQVLVTTVAAWLVVRLARVHLSFSSLFSVATYAYLPLALLAVLMAVLAATGVYADLTAEGIPPTSLRVLAPGLEPGLLATLMGRVELFTLWSTEVLGMGLAARSGRPVGQGLGLAAAVWLLVTLVSAALSGLVPAAPDLTGAGAGGSV